MVIRLPGIISGIMNTLYMTIHSSNREEITPFLKHVFVPEATSHKGQNGKALLVGGSQLFHAASMWAAETASHFLDIVHYASTEENNDVMKHLKKQFRNGIIVPRAEIPYYAEEDDAILIGPGMVRGDKHPGGPVREFHEIISLRDEPSITYELTKWLMQTHPDKKFVLDAGALQMMDLSWLSKLRKKAVLTPHQLEFERLFGISVSHMNEKEKMRVVKETAARYSCVILLKAIHDIVSDGHDTYVIVGGNQGLTKGGTGDTLAGLTLSLFAKSESLPSAVLASYILKTAADELYTTMGYWYNVEDLIQKIPTILKKLLYN